MPAFTGETGELPSVKVYRVRHTAEASASTDFGEICARIEVGGSITAARFVPDAAMTGATATATTLSISNVTQSTIPASTAFVTGTNLATGVPFLLTLGNAAAVAVNPGDILSFAKTHAGGGTQGPSGLLEIEVTRGDIA